MSCIFWQTSNHTTFSYFNIYVFMLNKPFLYFNYRDSYLWFHFSKFVSDTFSESSHSIFGSWIKMSISGRDNSMTRHTKKRIVHFLISMSHYRQCICLLQRQVRIQTLFLNRLDRWFSHLNGLTLLILGPFIACCSVWAKAPCLKPYFDL